MQNLVVLDRSAREVRDPGGVDLVDDRLEPRREELPAQELPIGQTVEQLELG